MQADLHKKEMEQMQRQMQREMQEMGQMQREMQEMRRDAQVSVSPFINYFGSL